MVTTINETGLTLIKKFEGLRLKAYKCAAGVWTIGYGHTKGVKEGDVITEKEAEALLQEDLDKFIDHVRYYDETYNYNFNENEFSALVSFAFNIGTLRGITNGGKRTKFQIGSKFNAYVYAGGKKLNGLIKRRAAEYNLYNTPVVNADNSYIVGSTYVICASGLNVRKEPCVTSEKAQKTSLKKGTKIVVEAVVLDTDGNTWLKISKGYIAAIYQGNVYVKEE